MFGLSKLRGELRDLKLSYSTQAHMLRCMQADVKALTLLVSNLPKAPREPVRVDRLEQALGYRPNKRG